MSVAIVHTRAVVALDAPSVIVETHLSPGLPAFNLVGLPETAVRESKDRVRSAILNSRFEFPARRITVNLAPADLPKEGGRFDLAIALGILAASGQIPVEPLAAYEFLGELALTGELRPVRGVLTAALSCQRDNRMLVLPAGNGAEAFLAVADSHRVADHLLAICAHLHGQQHLSPAAAPVLEAVADYPDMAEIRGQSPARRALEIAAAGGHNLLYEGPPGCGKSMLAQRLPGILPDMQTSEALDLLAIRSVSRQGFDAQYGVRRPFRSPHHSASSAALVGGGNPPLPGEISLAHHGVLFLDELAEFQRPVLEALREPLENGAISIARAGHEVTFPAGFQLVAAMNPCPCGYLGDARHACQCTPQQIQRYRSRISGPLLDRIDLHLSLQPTPLTLLTGTAAAGESSARVRQRVQQARERQLQRQRCCNSRLQGDDLHAACRLDEAARQVLQQLADRLAMSARALQRSLRVARTIADLEASACVTARHITEACSYRQWQLRQ